MADIVGKQDTYRQSFSDCDSDSSETTLESFESSSLHKEDFIRQNDNQIDHLVPSTSTAAQHPMANISIDNFFATSAIHFKRSLRFLTSSASRGRHHEAFYDIAPFSHFIYYALLTSDEAALKALLRNYLTHYKSQFPTGPAFHSPSMPSLIELQFGKDVFNLCRESVSDRKGELNRNWSAVESECGVCNQIRLLVPRMCCNFSICNECLANYLASEVQLRHMFTICTECPNCTVRMHQDEIKVRLHYSLFNQAANLYLKRLEEISMDGDLFLCSKCSNTLLAYNGPKLKYKNNSKIRISCDRCKSEHCASCRSPWHRGLSCKEYLRGDISMKKWTDQGSDQRNATYCPSCHTCYQKSDGCDHMYCQKCKTNFCYACGYKFRSCSLFNSQRQSLYHITTLLF